MSGEIKELNNAIQRITHSVVVHTPKYSKYGGYDGENDIYTMDIAKALHAEGYRKQSEGKWIYVHTYLRGGVVPFAAIRCSMIISHIVLTAARK